MRTNSDAINDSDGLIQIINLEIIPISIFYNFACVMVQSCNANTTVKSSKYEKQYNNIQSFVSLTENQSKTYSL